MDNLMFVLSEPANNPTFSRELVQFRFPNGFTASIRKHYGGVEIAAFTTSPAMDHWVTAGFQGKPYSTTSTQVMLLEPEDGARLGQFITWVASLPDDYQLEQLTDYEAELRGREALAATLSVEDYHGSVSTGTHRNSDLIESFMAVLETVSPRRYDDLCDEYVDVFRLFSEQGEGAVNYPEDVAMMERIGYFVNEVLFDALNEAAPEGYYFGAHPGDGADFGFWPVEQDDPYFEPVYFEVRIQRQDDPDGAWELVGRSADEGQIGALYRITARNHADEAVELRVVRVETPYDDAPDVLVSEVDMDTQVVAAW